MKIVADSHIPFVKEYFAAAGELILKPGRAIHADDVKDADILLVRSITHVDQNLLSGSKVKFVGSVTAGADHLDTKFLNDAGIACSIATGFNAPPVADYVVSIIAALQQKQLLPLERPKAAVIGVGNVGKLVVEKLKLLNFDVLVCDPIRAEQEKEFKHTPLEELDNVDFISLHVPLSRSQSHPTYHFIDKEFLKRQKKGCVLLNASRGAVVDSNALLSDGGQLNWCFDVWENEPHIRREILQRTIMATPHIAGYSVQSKIRGIDMIYRIACDKKIISRSSMSPLAFPKQELSFTCHQHSWQEVILGVFNPMVITAMMRTIFLPESGDANAFDEMRNQFNYRYEFAFTTLCNINVSEDDKKLLRSFGLKLEE